VQPITRSESELGPQLGRYHEPPLLPKHHRGIYKPIVPRYVRMCHTHAAPRTGGWRFRALTSAAAGRFGGAGVQRTLERALDFSTSFAGRFFAEFPCPTKLL